MVDRFNALARRGRVDFEAWFNTRTHDDRSWDVDEAEWAFSYKYVPSIRFGSLTVRLPSLLARSSKPDLVLMLHAEPIFVVAWLLAKARGIKVGFRVLKTFDRWVQRSRLKNALKHLMFSSADAIETPGDDGFSFAVENGADPTRVHRVTHTVDLERFSRLLAEELPRREELRRSHGVSGVTFLYVGRLWWGKGIRCLLEAFAQFSRAYDGEVSLLIVGDGEEQAQLESFVRDQSIRGVVFAGFKQKDELIAFYSIADVFVFPTLGDPYGIVVDEAMACGLPVISSTAAGEIKLRIEHGINGYLFEPDDVGTLTHLMIGLANDPALRSRMGQLSKEKVQSATPEQWAVEFESLVSRTLS